MKMKLDREMLTKQVEAFKDTNGRFPYIICSKKSKECFPKSIYTTTGIAYISSLSIDARTTCCSTRTEEPPKKDYEMYDGCKVFIDDDLEFAEVIFA